MNITQLTDHELYKRMLGALLYRRNSLERESVATKRLVFECERRNRRILECAERDAKRITAIGITPQKKSAVVATQPQKLMRIDFCSQSELKIIFAELGRPIPFVSVGDILPDEGCFVAKVTGNSMTHAGIEDGDVVIVRENDSVPDATVCVAYVEGELFVKRLFYRDDVEFRDDNVSGVFRVRPKQQWNILGRVTHAVKPVVFMD